MDDLRSGLQALVEGSQACIIKESKEHTMKPYPLGIDNPIKVKAVWGSHKWAIYWKDDFTKIATFNSEFQAYEARRSIIESL